MRNGKDNRGFAYIALLIGLVIIGIGLGAISEVWHQTRMRENEKELLFIGDQYRRAITNFYLSSPPGNRKFPMKFNDLLQDDRSPDKSKKYIRKLYQDPISGNLDWGEVRLPNGQLVGIYSKSDLTPLKMTGFSSKDRGFENKKIYSDWIFQSKLLDTISTNPNKNFAN
jgi:type II secretory pathway pseudopilin PulG